MFEDSIRNWGRIIAIYTFVSRANMHFVEWHMRDVNRLKELNNRLVGEILPSNILRRIHDQSGIISSSLRLKTKAVYRATRRILYISYRFINSSLSTNELNDSGYPSHFTSDFFPRFLIIFFILNISWVVFWSSFLQKMPRISSPLYWICDIVNTSSVHRGVYPFQMFLLLWKPYFITDKKFRFNGFGV